MPEFSNDAELFTGTGPAREGHEPSFEQFQDEQRQTQAALQQLWKEEGQVKQQDDQLAQIILRFLNDPANTHLFLLIARCVSHNVPSEFIISIISLIDKGAHEQIQRFLAAPSVEVKADPTHTPTRALVVRKPESLETIPADRKATIDQWIQRQQQVALKMPQRILSSVMQRNPAGQRILTMSVLQLGSVVLRDYLTKAHITVDFESIQEFMQTVYVEMLKTVEAFLTNQKMLK